MPTPHLWRFSAVPRLRQDRQDRMRRRMVARRATRYAIWDAQSAVTRATRALDSAQKDLLAWAMAAPDAPLEAVEICQRKLDEAEAALDQLKGAKP
jgi:hypothetical protein